MRQRRSFCNVEYAPEEYTRHYIVQALFKLMNEYVYEKISVTDIAVKAGVGRATFYRYFKSKEDVINFYFEHNTKQFVFAQRYIPRCKEDHKKIVTDVLTLFKKNIEPFKLLRKARLEYIYLDYLNKVLSKLLRTNTKTIIYMLRIYMQVCFLIFLWRGLTMIATKV